jgi:hypothetical protein
VATWTEALNTLEALGEVEEVPALCGELCLQLALAYRVADLVVVAQRGLAAIGDGARSDRARLLATRALAFSLMGRYQESSTDVAEARRLVAGETDTGLVGEVSLCETVHHNCFMQTSESVETGRRAVKALRSTNAVWSQCYAMCQLAPALAGRGHITEADEVQRELAPLAQRIGDWGSASVHRRTTFLNAATRADLPLASAVADELCVVAGDTGNPVWLATARTLVGIAEFWRGEWTRAREDLIEGAGLATPNVWFGAHHGSLLVFLAVAGDREALGGVLDEVAHALPTLGTANTFGAWLLGIMAAEATAIVGDTEHARMLYPLVLESLATGTLIRHFDGGLIERSAAMAAAAAELPERAEEHFETALRQADELSHVMERLHVRHHYARFLIERGGAADHERAPIMLDEAVAGYRHLGMPRHEAMAEELLHALRA